MRLGKRSSQKHTAEKAARDTSGDRSVFCMGAGRPNYYGGHCECGSEYQRHDFFHDRIPMCQHGQLDATGQPRPGLPALQKTSRLIAGEARLYFRGVAQLVCVQTVTPAQVRWR